MTFYRQAAALLLVALALAAAGCGGENSPTRGEQLLSQRIVLEAEGDQAVRDIQLGKRAGLTCEVGNVRCLRNATLLVRRSSRKLERLTRKLQANNAALRAWKRGQGG